MIGNLAAIESDDVEIWIADNSGDKKKASILENIKKQYNHLHVINNRTDFDMKQNYQSLLHHANGHFAFFCADDDYLDTGFVYEAINQLGAAGDNTCLVPPIYQYLGNGVISPITRLDDSADASWVDRVITHINSRVIPLLTYSIVPLDLLNEFYFEYLEFHPMVASFMDWHLEYYLRSWCRCTNVDSGFYLYDYQRWTNSSTAIEADSRYYSAMGVPEWFVVFHRLYWAVDLCNFVDSRFFPGGGNDRDIVINRLIDCNMTIFRHEISNLKQDMFIAAPLSKELKNQVIELVHQPSWKRDEITLVFEQILRKVSPCKTREYDGFISRIQYEHPVSVFPESNAQEESQSSNLPAIEEVQFVRNPLVSVIVPCYQQAQYLADSLGSVLAQTYPNIECIVVDDGSPDHTAEVVSEFIQKYPESDIKLVRKANGGLSSARNSGVAKAKGEFILPLDADDRLHPLMIEKLIEALVHFGKDIAYCDIKHFGACDKFWETGPFRLEDEIHDNRIPYCSLYRRVVFDEVGGYCTDLDAYEDWDFWVGALDKGFSAVKVPGGYFYYRKSENSMLVEANKRRQELISRIILRHAHLYEDHTIEKAKSLLTKSDDDLDMSGEERKKVLFACDYFWPSVGGLETIVANLGASLITLGYEVEVATRALAERTSNMYQGMPIHSLDVKIDGDQVLPRASRQLRGLIESANYDFVIMLADPLNWVIWSLQDAEIPPHTKVLVQPLINEKGYSKWRRAEEFRQRMATLLKQVYKVISLTREGPDAQFLKEEGIANVFLPNATTPRETVLDFRCEFGFAPDQPLIVHVANLWPVKNHLNLIRMFHKLGPEYQMALIGNPSADTSYVNQVRNAVAEDERIRLIHGIEGEWVAAAMKAADLVVLASEGEVFPVTIVEAMSHAKTWLATPECGAVRELCGGVVAPLPEFPRIITKLIGNRALLTRLGKLGHAHWKACLNWNFLARAWQTLMEQGSHFISFEPPQEIRSETIRICQNIVNPESRGNVKELRGEMPYSRDDECLFSIIVPTYNRPELLLHALRSIGEQTFRDFEVVLINDGGESVEHRLNEFDFVLHSVRHGVNRGLSGARNTGLSLACGVYIVYLDDDDLMLPNHLQVLADAITSYPDSVLYTDADLVVETIEGNRRFEYGRGNPYQHDDFSPARLLVSNFIPVNTFCHPRSVIDSIGMFDESLTAFEDWDFLLRLSKVLPFHHIRQTTVEVRTIRDSHDHHMLSRERKNFPELYGRIYRQYPSDDKEVLIGRERILASFGGRNQAGNVHTEDTNSPAFSQNNNPRIYDIYLSRKKSLCPAVIDLPDPCPSFTFVVPCRENERERLAATLETLGAQSLDTWQLVVVADFPAPDPLWDELEQVSWVTLADPTLPGYSVVEMIEARTSSWVCLLRPGAQLVNDALVQLTLHVTNFPNWRLIYSDSDHIDQMGKRHDPLFRPDFNLDLLRSMSYLGECVWIESATLKQIGGPEGLGSADGYDMALKVLDAFGEQVIGHIDEVLYHVPVDETAQEDAPYKQVLKDHLRRRGIETDVVDGYLPGTWKVDYRVRGTPLVSILIPVRHGFRLPACVLSILEKTRYQNYEILLVDHSNTDTKVKSDLLAMTENPRVRLLDHYVKGFNMPAMWNLAVSHAEGEYVVLLRDDTTILSENWLDRMLAHAQRPEIGAVGVKLMSSESALVQHAGFIMGLGGIADHAFRDSLTLDEGGYMGLALVEQNRSAVSHACMMVSRTLWKDVGGMDEQAFKQEYHDVDLCLKIGRAGYKVIWTPFVVVLEHREQSESLETNPPLTIRNNQRRNDKNKEIMYGRWLPLISKDLAYNRHLSLNYRDYRVEPDITINWNPRLSSSNPRILGWVVDGAPSEYRIKQPLQALLEQGFVQTGCIHPPEPGKARCPMLVEIARLEPQIFTSTAFLGLSKNLDPIKQLRKHTNIPFLLHIDDLISQVPKGSNLHHLKNSIGQLKKLVRLANRVVVTTQPLLEVLSKSAEEIVCIPNYLPRSVWEGLYSQRRVVKKPRVGWAGALQHGGDLAMIEQVVMELANEVEWVFFGMCPDSLRPYVEFHEPVPFAEYPAKLATLNLDLAIAPLENNRFNECKSNLRLLEYGMMGWPVVCSDIQPYREAPVARVPNRSRFWIEAIRERIHDLDHTEREGDRLRNWVLKYWMLEDHLDGWLEAYRF